MWEELETRLAQKNKKFSTASLPMPEFYTGNVEKLAYPRPQLFSKELMKELKELNTSISCLSPMAFTVNQYQLPAWKELYDESSKS